MRNILLAILTPTTLMLACATSEPEGGDPEDVGEVTSPIYKGDTPDEEVIARARYWFDQGQDGKMGSYTNAHCNITGRNDDNSKDASCHRDKEGNGVYPNTHFYRRDCSGMASMALHMGYSTNTAGFRDGDFDFSRLGDDENAKPGDLVLSTASSSNASKFGSHTIIFERWIDGTHWKGFSGGAMPPSHNTYTVSKSDGTITNMDKNDGGNRVFHAWRSPHVVHGGPKCVAKSCVKLGIACGAVAKDENCGTALNCGGCGTGEACDDGQCKAVQTDSYAKAWFGGKIRNGGECASGSNPIEMNACSASALGQDYHLTKERRLRNDKTGNCLEPASISDGSVTRQAACGGDDQIWRFRHMEIVNGDSGYCLDVPMADYHAGQHVIEWPCHGADNQRYTYMPQTGELRIQGWCLDAGSAANGAPVTLQHCDGTSAQQWNDDHGGFVSAVATAKPRCLALASSKLVVGNCNDATDQMWALRGPIEHRDDEFCLKHAANDQLKLVQCVEGRADQTFTFWMNF